jgi:hypothetical protein
MVEGFIATPVAYLVAEWQACALSNAFDSGGSLLLGIWEVNSNAILFYVSLRKFIYL